jgi:hypothetical protein
VNGVAAKIEIFKPFEEAFELTKQILFKPFDFKKWCVLGFAAFLAYLNFGGFSGFRFPAGNWTNQVSVQHEDFRSFVSQMQPIWIVLIAVGIFMMLAMFVVLSWVRARGHFIFIDCLVHNRAAIARPWNEYSAEGNSYFLFMLLVVVVILTVVILAALIVLVPMFMLGNRDHNGLLLLPLLGFVIFLPLMFVFLTILQFVAPVMYRRRCRAWLAFTDLISLLAKHLGIFILYFLFSIVVGIGVAIVMVMATCLTCCIAAIPYVGIVILLPVYVLLQSFSLLFLRQFGSEYDVWTGIEPATVPPSLPTTLPPVQS